MYLAGGGVYQTLAVFVYHALGPGIDRRLHPVGQVTNLIVRVHTPRKGEGRTQSAENRRSG